MTRYTKRMNYSLGDQTIEQIRLMARIEHRTQSDQLRHMVDEYRRIHHHPHVKPTAEQGDNQRDTITSTVSH